MQSKSKYIISNNKSIFQYSIIGESKLCSNCFVFCHSFGDEHNNSVRTFFETASGLSIDGYSSIIFDFEGYGDSEGDISELKIEAWIQNIKDIIAGHILENPGHRIFLVGLRFSAALCLLSAQTIPNLQRIILIDPYISFSKYFHSQGMRQKISGMFNSDDQNAQVDLTNPETSCLMVDDICINMDTLRHLDQFNGQVIAELHASAHRISIVCINNGRSRTRNSKEFIKFFPANSNVECIDVLMRPFWNRLTVEFNYSLVTVLNSIAKHG